MIWLLGVADIFFNGFNVASGYPGHNSHFSPQVFVNLNHFFKAASSQEVGQGLWSPQGPFAQLEL